MDADVVDALTRIGTEHPIEKVVERLVGLIAEADAAPAAGLNLVMSVALIEHVSTIAAPVKVPAANGVAVGRVEHAHLVGADEGYGSLADRVALAQLSALFRMFGGDWFREGLREIGRSGM